VQALTQREQEVLVLICSGWSTDEIAANLEIAGRTIACHRRRILEKVGVRNSAALVLWAIQHGYVEIEQSTEPLSAGAAAKGPFANRRRENGGAGTLSLIRTIGGASGHTFQTPVTVSRIGAQVSSENVRTRGAAPLRPHWCGRPSE
jgi:DNA-binding CsgD family transcriptional regulator